MKLEMHTKYTKYDFLMVQNLMQMAGILWIQK